MQSHTIGMHSIMTALEQSQRRPWLHLAVERVGGKQASCGASCILNKLEAALHTYVFLISMNVSYIYIYIYIFLFLCSRGASCKAGSEAGSKAYGIYIFTRSQLTARTSG